jgi:DNA-binding MarR family transcriptional regulator
MYYPRVPEVSVDGSSTASLTPHDALLTSVATDLHATFSAMPRQQVPAPARDLTLGQVRLLFMLRREGPQPMGRVAEVFDLSTTASTGFVERVERHGLVTRRHRLDDRRVVECALTATGTRFLEDISGIRLDVTRRALGALEPHDLAEFGRLLGIIHDHQDHGGTSR